MYKVVVDFAWLERIQDVLELLKKHNGQIDSYEPKGNAGGNPNIVLRFDQRGDAVDYLRERYPDDSLALCNERVNGPLNKQPVLSPFAWVLIRRLLAMHAEVGDEADNKLAAEVVADLPTFSPTGLNLK